MLDNLTENLTETAHQKIKLTQHKGCVLKNMSSMRLQKFLREILCALL